MLEVFAFLGVDDATAIVVAVGTAQATIVVASVTAAIAHWRGGTIDAGLMRAWLPALLLGTTLGLAFGSMSPAKPLTNVFAVVAVALAVKLALGERPAFRPWQGLLPNCHRRS